MIEFLMIPGAPTPVAPTSHAVAADGWLFVTGQMPTDPDDDSAALPEGIETQTRRVIEKLKLVLAGVAGHDDVDDGWAVALGEPGRERRPQRLGVLDPNAADAHRAGNRRVIHLGEIGRLIAPAHHRVLQCLHVT